MPAILYSSSFCGINVVLPGFSRFQPALVLILVPRLAPQTGPLHLGLSSLVPYCYVHYVLRLVRSCI